MLNEAIYLLEAFFLALEHLGCRCIMACVTINVERCLLRKQNIVGQGLQRSQRWSKRPDFYGSASSQIEKCCRNIQYNPLQ